MNTSGKDKRGIDRRMEGMLGISDAVELTRKVDEFVKAGMTLEFQEAILKLREAVMNAKEEVLQLREDNRLLRAEVSKKLAWLDTSASASSLQRTLSGAMAATIDLT